MKKLISSIVLVMASLLFFGPSMAGDLDPSAEPGPSMHSLEEIYQELVGLKAEINELRLLVNGSGRFVDLRNGAVKDNMTGLVWLKKADCFDSQNWSDANATAAALASGQCGLSDDSVPGDWRLPTQAEWESLTDREYSDPALVNATGSAQWSEGDVFTGVESAWYWSGDTHGDYPEDALMWYSVDGFTNWHTEKTDAFPEVWPVRSGH